MPKSLHLLFASVLLLENLLPTKMDNHYSFLKRTIPTAVLQLQTFFTHGAAILVVWTNANKIVFGSIYGVRSF